MKKIISLIIIFCLVFSTLTTMTFAKENENISIGFLNTINAKTGKAVSYQGISKNGTVYMMPNDIAAIGEYECDFLSLDKEKVERTFDNFPILSKLYSYKLNFEKIFNNDKFECLVFSRNRTTDYITQIFYYNGFAQTMNKSFEIDTIKYDGNTYLNLEKMLYLMHAQWCVDDSFLFFYPLSDNIFDFIGKNFSYMRDRSVQHNSLLMEGENRWGHATRIVLSHILNDIDMRIFIPFYGSDMIQQDWYEEAILQLATTDDSFIDDASSERISKYLEDSTFSKIETDLSAIDTSLEGTINVLEFFSNMPETKLNKFSKWNDFSTISTAQFRATQIEIGNITDIVHVANILVDFNEINTRSKEWGDDFINGLELLCTINEDIYGDYGKYIVNAADNLLDEFDNPTEAAAETAMIDSYKWVLNKLLDKTIIGHIESIITLSNAIIKSNPDYASQIENADLMNTVHALIDVENVFLNEFVDSYHNYIHYLGIEDESSSLMLWQLIYGSINNNPQKTVESNAISEMRNALEMFLKTSLRNKTYVYHFNYFNDSFWTLTTAAQELKEDIYKTYALLSQLISTRDYDQLLYLDETFGSMYSNEYGQIRDKINDIILTKEILSYREEDTSTSSESIETTTETGNHNQNTIFAGGNGTENNPYKVSTPEQLNAVRNNLSAHYVQINDIDMSEWGEWEPIGTVLPEYDGPSNIGLPSNSTFDNHFFTGIYDGDCYSISNLSIFKDPFTPNLNSYGLFAGVSEGSIMNVNLVNIKYEVIKRTPIYEYTPKRMVHYSICVGGIAGKVNADANIENCSVSGNINVADHYYAYVGGVVGYGAANHCVNYANVRTYSDDGNAGKEICCGGITGSPFYSNSKIQNCKNYGNIEAIGNSTVYCGGISGQYGNIENCENHGTIIGKATSSYYQISPIGNCNVGGIVSVNQETVNSINYGNVYSYCTDKNNCYAGGIVGYSFENGGFLENNYNYGNIIIAQGLKGETILNGYASRIAGYSINILNCYSIDSTTINGSFPMQYNTHDNINGGTLTKIEMDKAIESLN